MPYAAPVFTAIPHKDSAADAPSAFSSECEKRANNLTVIKQVLGRITEKGQADVVLSPKAFSRRCCLNISFYIIRFYPLIVNGFAFYK